MPLARYALAAAAACLIGGVAVAQPAPSDNAQPPANPPATSDQTPPPAQPAATAQPPSQTTEAPTGAAANTSATAGAPVPDTPANRAKYGQPLSRAGKRTKPAGN
jgi:hypothetical protein